MADRDAFHLEYTAFRPTLANTQVEALKTQMKVRHITKQTYARVNFKGERLTMSFISVQKEIVFYLVEVL